MCHNPAPRKPFDVCREDRRDHATTGLEYVGIAADDVGRVDEVEHCLDSVRVRRMHCVDDVDSLAVVDFFGTESARFVAITADDGDDMRAARARNLGRIAPDPTGRAEHDEALTGGHAK